MSRRISLSPAEDRPRFNDIVASALRLRNSIPLELALVVLAFASPLGGDPAARIVFVTVHDEAEMVKKSLAIARMKN